MPLWTRSRTSSRIIAVLFCVLLLDWADRGIVGAVAPELKTDFGIGNTQIGLLASSFSVVGALASLPVGVLVDRVRRITLLTGAVALWSLAVLLSGAATGFAVLLVSRLVLGALAATSGPALPSLIGDLVPSGRRARMLGVVETGQLAGTGVAFLLSAAAVAVMSWRWAFWILGAAGLLVSLLLHALPEPERTGGAGPVGEEGSAPADWSLLRAARHVLSVRTNVIALAAVSVGNYFFAGVGTFAVVYVTKQFDVSTAAADLGVLPLAVGAIGGMLLGGRLGDHLQRRGVVGGRLKVAAGGYLGAAAFALPSLLTRSIPLAVVLITLGVACLNAAAPTLDAVRLDVIHPQLRGRAEAVRTVVRTVAEGAAPVLFGLLADHLAGGGHRGLQLTFLVTLPALVVNGLLLLIAVRTYPAEAAAVEDRSGSGEEASVPVG